MSATYLILSPEQEAFKVGRAERPQDRMYGIATGNPSQMVMLMLGPPTIEAGLLKRLRATHHWLRGEWFHEDGLADLWLALGWGWMDGVTMSLLWEGAEDVLDADANHRRFADGGCACLDVASTAEVLGVACSWRDLYQQHAPGWQERKLAQEQAAATMDGILGWIQI